MIGYRGLALIRDSYRFLKSVTSASAPLLAAILIILFLLSTGCAKQEISKDKQSAKKTTTGLSLYRKGKYKQAIEMLKEAVALNPKNGEALKTLGLSYEAKGSFSNAGKSYEKSIKVSPGQYEVIYMLAILYKSDGNKKGAIQQLEKAISIKKDFIGARIVLGDLYAEQRDNEKALKMYQSILDLKPYGTDLKAIEWKMDGLKRGS